MRAKFPSEMKGAQKARALRRIERDSIPEVVEAIASGRLAVAWADEISRLPSGEQEGALAARLEPQARRWRAEREAARAIGGYLDSRERGVRPDLEEVWRLLREACGKSEHSVS
jgi:hypothetical protein